MKLLIFAPEERYRRYLPDLPAAREADMIFVPKGTSDQAAAAACPDAQVICVDSLTTVDAALIQALPALRLIHVEGVGYNQIDLKAATERGVYVCNNTGCNAPSVAEHAIMLMLMLLHRGVDSHMAVMTGHQENVTNAWFQDTMPELADCAVGLIGFGEIAQAVAVRLRAFGSTVYYHAPHRRPLGVEEACGAQYLPLDELPGRCDIISLHCPATPSSYHLVDAAFMRRMRSGSYLVNTARGQVVDDQALIAALASGHLAGAGLDAFDPEPVRPDHPLLTAPASVKDRLLLTPHSAGLTTSAFLRAHRNIWNNISLLAEGGRPQNIVNPL